jgi:hypothetical protein
MVKFPSAPGIYRMVAMLHTADGVAYDAATQAMVTPIIVHVRPPVAVAYGAPAGVTLTRGAGAQLPVNVLNAGGRRWDKEVTAAPNRVAGESGVLSRTTTLPAQLVATWVSPDGRQVPSPLAVRLDDKVAAPGGSASLALRITAPDAPGTYLLLLDVLSASAGALSSQGSDPAIVRVTVVDAPAATPQPAPTATPVPTPAATPKAAPDAPTKPAPKAAPGSGPKRPDA